MSVHQRLVLYKNTQTMGHPLRYTQKCFITVYRTNQVRVPSFCAQKTRSPRLGNCKHFIYRSNVLQYWSGRNSITFSYRLTTDDRIIIVSFKSPASIAWKWICILPGYEVRFSRHLIMDNIQFFSLVFELGFRFSRTVAEWYSLV